MSHPQAIDAFRASSSERRPNSPPRSLASGVAWNRLAAWGVVLNKCADALHVGTHYAPCAFETGTGRPRYGSDEPRCVRARIGKLHIPNGRAQFYLFRDVAPLCGGHWKT
jgi:hypothetical protein